MLTAQLTGMAGGSWDEVLGERPTPSSTAASQEPSTHAAMPLVPPALSDFTEADHADATALDTGDGQSSARSHDRGRRSPLVLDP